MKKKELIIAALQKTRLPGFYLILFFLVNIGAQAQPCTLTPPALFGNPVDKIVCRGGGANLGVNNTLPQLEYFFYTNNGSVRSLGGPLDGNGGSVSVEAFIASARSAGQYYAEVREGNCSATNVGFYVYYGDIDDLTITAWGSNSVSFSWASCGRSPYVKYEYAVSTVANPDNIPTADTATTYNTSATVNGLVAGTTYYIHVKVFKVYKEPAGGSNGEEVSDECGSLSWQTRQFIACSGASAATGSISPTDAFVCAGGSATLTATTGASSYQWYKDGAVIIPNMNTNTLNITGPGNYSTYITTAGCQGMAYSKYVTTRTTVPGIFSGGGSFCGGDQVRLGISRTNVNQTYEIRKNGQLVTALQGIGISQGFPSSEDTLWYNFIINSPTQTGNYTVTTFNTPCQSITFGSQNVVLLSSGNITPATASICTGGSQLLTATGGSTYAWSRNGVPIAGSTTTGSYTATQAGTFSVIITSGTCSSPAMNTAVITETSLPAGTAEWTGAVNTVWSNIANWKCGQLPANTTAVIINGGMPNYPVITSNLTVKSMTVNSGASVQVSPGVVVTLTGI